MKKTLFGRDGICIPVFKRRPETADSDLILPREDSIASLNFGDVITVSLYMIWIVAIREGSDDTTTIDTGTGLSIGEVFSFVLNKWYVGSSSFC